MEGLFFIEFRILFKIFNLKLTSFYLIYIFCQSHFPVFPSLDMTNFQLCEKIPTNEK